MCTLNNIETLNTRIIHSYRTMRAFMPVLSELTDQAFSEHDHIMRNALKAFSEFTCQFKNNTTPSIMTHPTSVTTPPKYAIFCATTALSTTLA